MTRTTIGGGIAMLLMAAAIGCAGAPDTVLEQLMESRRLAADLLAHFAKASDAADRAVMADTDETSAAFAHEADQATQTVQADVKALTPMLASLGYTKESQIMKEFGQRFDDYHTLDRTILDLAVENTNLKAQRLSFGQGQADADLFRDTLAAITPAVVSDASRMDALRSSAIASVREIQVLQAPHIAESDDDAMTRIETRMKTAESSARTALAAIAGLIRPASKAKLDAANGALDQFLSVNAEILKLSRRNSNVRSLALSLGQKRTLAAACEERLQALQDALSREGMRATR